MTSVKRVRAYYECINRTQDNVNNVNAILDFVEADMERKHLEWFDLLCSSTGDYTYKKAFEMFNSMVADTELSSELIKLKTGEYDYQSPFLLALQIANNERKGIKIK